MSGFPRTRSLLVAYILLLSLADCLVSNSWKNRGGWEASLRGLFGPYSLNPHPGARECS